MVDKKEYVITCDRCGIKYSSIQYKKCPECNSGMKRPHWEKEKRWITKNTAVIATPKFGTPSVLIPAFTNFYFNQDENELRRNKICFKNQEELEKALDGLNDITNFIGWKKKIEYLEKVKERKKETDDTTKEVSELIKQYPRTILDVLKSFDPEMLADDINLNLTKEIVKNLNEGIFKTEEQVKISFKNVLKRISKEDKRAMDELSELLETNSLLELTSVGRILMSRLTTLELFESMAHNENIYEVKGSNSIQSILERNMWILNEEWWLVQANKGLKSFIGDEIEKQKGRKRPDFVCVTFEGKLIIVEIKRPSHEINKNDIDQVEEYKLIAKEYKGESFRNISCYVVGKKIPSKARGVANERKNIQLLTYNDLVEGVRKKYTEYLKALEEARKTENKDN